MNKVLKDKNKLNESLQAKSAMFSHLDTEFKVFKRETKLTQDKCSAKIVDLNDEIVTLKLRTRTDTNSIQ